MRFPLLAATSMLALALPASATTPIDDSLIAAERDAASRAQSDGQWTALREAMAEGAIMFVPIATAAKDWLGGMTGNPPSAPSWTPERAYLSCDGRIGVTTGRWRTLDGAAQGYFSTVWEKQDAKAGERAWRWVMDHAGELKAPRAARVSAPTATGAAEPLIVRASCSPGAIAPIARPLAPPTQSGAASSPDGTLRWSWAVGKDGGRTVTVALWNGATFDEVLRDEVPPET